MSDHFPIHIHVPQQTWPTAWKEAIYRSIQSAPELGMVYKATLSDLLTENAYRTGLWVATDRPLEEISEDDFTVVGAAICGSRAASTHMWRHGDICVPNEYRRHRVGTALYFAQHCQAILEGRRIIEDTIVPALSPWMVRSSECGSGFLRVLEYEHFGTLPERTRGFRDIELWGKVTLEAVQTGLGRLKGYDVTIEIRDTPKTLDGYQKNVEISRAHDAHLADSFDQMRTLLSASPRWETDETAVRVNYTKYEEEDMPKTKKGGQKNGERS